MRLSPLFQPFVQTFLIFANEDFDVMLVCSWLILSRFALTCHSIHVDGSSLPHKVIQRPLRMPNMAGEQVTDDAVSVEVYAERHVTTSHAHEEMTFAVSAMLVSAVCFVMGLFYMVNFPDEDIQYYTYHTVGLAISLFSALLIFAALKSAISHKFLEGDLTILASLLHALFWFCAMQVGAAYFSGGVSWTSPKSNS